MAGIKHMQSLQAPEVSLVLFEGAAYADNVASSAVACKMRSARGMLSTDSDEAGSPA